MRAQLREIARALRQDGGFERVVVAVYDERPGAPARHAFATTL